MPDARTRDRTRRDRAVAVTCGDRPATDAARDVRLPGRPVMLRTGEAAS
ncbi:hypothetical protein AB0N87_23450 [Streptomyces sp. NPDC093228]|jgi:hypothetical protein|nr:MULTISPECIES: hypothetical protein [unclassified Streptomyces]MDX3260300.1 hypothetical protein [Streptomyces sp. MI02-2A]REE63119.1 hypothetical protein BX257_5755 [Streptomyces sp. 3212.3]